jgi:diguanylate cyclase (GGDEF)-like protein
MADREAERRAGVTESSLAGRSVFPPVGRALSYVLVADADSRRIDICLDAVSSHGIGALVARTSEAAAGVLRDFGAPVLLIVDLMLPQQAGLPVIETVRHLNLECGGILAWSPARAVREFAASRLAGMNARILSASVGPSIIRSAIERLLEDGNTAGAEVLPSPSSSSDGVQETIAELTEKAREICGTAGIAVYLRGGPDQPFRSSATWLHDEPIPRSLDDLPKALKRILETREPLVALNVGSDSFFEAPRPGVEGLQGLVAVPVINDHDEVAGMICVFDVKPLTLGMTAIDALKALGRRDRRARPRGGAIAFPPSPHPRVRGMRDARAPARSDTSERPATLLDRQVGSLALTREMARARRKENHLSVVVFDVDVAESADAHKTADDPVESVGQTLAQIIRGYDLAIRWSRQELLVVLPGVGETDATRVAERVRDAVSAGSGTRIAVANGVAELDDDHTLESIVVRANENLRARRQSANLHL